MKASAALALNAGTFAWKPDLILRKLRADERLGGTPVIFLTAKGMTADRIEGFQAGCDDYHPKPVDFSKLLSQISAALGETAQASEATVKTASPAR